MDQGKRFPFTYYCQDEIVKEDIVPLDGTCLRDKTNNYRMCCSGQYFKALMTIFKYMCEQRSNAIVDEVNDC